MPSHPSRITSGGRLLVLVVLLAAGYLAGIASREATVQADGRRGDTQQQHFQSGAQRSEALLRDISATLDKMDARLERMEKLATQVAGNNSRRLPEEARTP